MFTVKTRIFLYFCYSPAAKNWWFQKRVWRLVCQESEKISISYNTTFQRKKVATNNLRSPEKCFAAGKRSKIDFWCSCFLDFYVKIIQIDVFLMVLATSWLFRSSCMAVHGCTRIEKIHNRQKWAKTWKENIKVLNLEKINTKLS